MYFIKEDIINQNIFQYNIFEKLIKNNFLFYTSLFFISNVICAYYKKDYIYLCLFLNLTITSLLVHSNNNIYIDKNIICILDKIIIYLIVLYGSYNVYNKTNINNKNHIILIIFTFIYCIYVYHFGYIKKKYCFDPQIDVSNRYHGTLHLFGSIGHNLILFL